MGRLSPPHGRCLARSWLLCGMRAALLVFASGVVAVPAAANPYDFATPADIYKEIDRKFPNLEDNEYTRLIDRARSLTDSHANSDQLDQGAAACHGGDDGR